MVKITYKHVSVSYRIATIYPWNLSRMLVSSQVFQKETEKIKLGINLPFRRKQSRVYQALIKVCIFERYSSLIDQSQDLTQYVRKNITLSIILSITASRKRITKNCPPEFTLLEKTSDDTKKSCYFVSTKHENWENAKRHCESMNS